jgi:hypothetical protein
MKWRVIGLSVLAVAVLAMVSALAGQNANRTDEHTVAAKAEPAPCIACSPDGKATPRSAEGHPDLNGLWGAGTGEGYHIASRAADGSVLFDFGGDEVRSDGRTFSSTPRTDPKYEGSDFGRDSDRYNGLSEPTYKPEYAAKVKKMVDENEYGVALANDPLFDCTPDGIPRAGGTMQIVQTPQVTAILYESSPGPVYRIIYTDGRPHPDPADLDTSPLGNSIGHWDGDTLVTDVIGLSDDTWLGGGFAGPKYARFHSDKEHVVERWTRSGDMMTYEATVEDPVLFAKPWVITPRRMRHSAAGSLLLDEPCVPNDKGHIVKPTKADPFLCNWGPKCVTSQNDTSHHAAAASAQPKPAATTSSGASKSQ